MMRGFLQAFALAAALRAQVPPPLHPVQLPQMTSVQLPNGLKLYLVEDHELPVIEGLVAVRAGSAFDPPGRPGLARLTVHALRTAAASAGPGADGNDVFDRLGARTEELLSETSCGFTFVAPRESADELLKVFKAMLAEPAFRLEQLEVAKAVGRSALMRREENTAEAAMRGFLSSLYGPNSAFGRQETEAGIASIGLGDVKEFYRRYFVPANTSLAIQGDFDPAAMRAAIERLFGGWTADQAKSAEAPKAAAAPPGAYAVPARNVLRVHLVMGQMGVGVQDRDAAAWEVLVTVLGGTNRSRLLEHVRSPVPGDGLDIGAQWIADLDRGGIFSIEVSCASPGLSGVLEGIRSEVKKLVATPVTDEEMRQARDAVLAKLVGGQDTKLKRLSTALMGETAGLPAGWVSRYQAAIAAVTRADVDRLARTLDPARFTIVAVGDGEDIRQRLKTFGRDAAILEAGPSQKGNATAVQPDPQAVERGRQLITRAQEASGGAAGVAALKDATRTAAFEQVSAGGASQVLTQRWLLPNHFREETVPGRYAIYTNGAGGFVTDGVSSNTLSGNLLEQARAQLFQFYPRLLLGDAVPGRTVFAVDGDAVEIREGAQSARLVFDRGGLPAEILYEASSAAGLPLVIEEVLEDFRPVGGVKMPFRVRVLHNGRQTSLVTVQELKVNSGLKIEDMTKRQ